MPIDFVAALSQEIADLETEIAQDPRITKLKELKRLQALFYASGGTVSRKPIGNDTAPAANPPASSQLGRKASPERDIILKEAEHLVLSAGGVPVPTAQIVALLADRGVEVPGTKAINNVSAILSTSGRFVANGRRGWTMRPLSKEEEKTEELLGQSPDHVAYPDDQESDLESEEEADADEQRFNAGIVN